MIKITVIEELAVAITPQEHMLVATRGALDQGIDSREGMQVEIETEAGIRQVSRDDQDATGATKNHSRGKVTSVVPRNTSSQVTVKGHSSREVASVAEELIALIIDSLDLDLMGWGVLLMSRTALMRGKRTVRFIMLRVREGSLEDFLEQSNIPVNMLSEEGEEGRE